MWPIIHQNNLNFASFLIITMKLKIIPLVQQMWLNGNF
jgi:hypothetical protein